MKSAKQFSLNYLLLVHLLIPGLAFSACNSQNENRRHETISQTATEVAPLSSNDDQTLVTKASNISEVTLPAESQKNTAMKSEIPVPPETDIHTAVLKNDIETVKKHIAAKSDLNVKESFGGSTPLISAALFGRTEIAALLINAGAGLNIQNNDGSTALITASFFCRDEIVKLLLAKRADKSIKNKYGQTAYEILLPSFSEAKPVYDMLGSALAPIGLVLDYAHIEKTRPVIAAMLK